MALRYEPALDGIRALAILMVVGFHAKVPGLHGGSFGVDVFFVLSGYLITRILVGEHERTGKLDLLRFYGRRLRRLYPAMITLLAVYLLLAPWLFPHPSMRVHLRDATVAALYLSDYSHPLHMKPHVMVHLWSLSIEEHFYLVWPLVLLFVMRLRPPAAIASLVVLYVAATLWRAHSVPQIHWDVYHRFDTHASGLVLGCLIGYIGKRLPAPAALVGFAGLAATCVLYKHGGYDMMYTGFTAAELSSACIILAAPAWLGVAPLAWLGRLSYGLYLWHYPIDKLIRTQYHFDWRLTLPISLFGGLALAALSYYTIERLFRAPRRVPTLHPAVDSAAT